MDDRLHEKLINVNEQDDVEAGLDLAVKIGYQFWGLLMDHHSEVVKLSDEAIVQLKADLKSRIIGYVEDEDGQWLQE